MIDEAWQKVVHAAASAGFVLTDQVIQIVRVMAIALVAWAGLELVQMRSAMAVMQTQLATMTTAVGKLEGKFEATVDDRWRRSDHERFSDSLDRRLTGIEARLDAQARAISGKRGKDE